MTADEGEEFSRSQDFAGVKKSRARTGATCGPEFANMARKTGKAGKMATVPVS
jgi:hypothetical protein